MHLITDHLSGKNVQILIYKSTWWLSTVVMTFFLNRMRGWFILFESSKVYFWFIIWLIVLRNYWWNELILLIYLLQSNTIIISKTELFSSTQEFSLVHFLINLSFLKWLNLSFISNIFRRINHFMQFLFGKSWMIWKFKIYWTIQ